MAINFIYHNFYLQMGVAALLGASPLNWPCDYRFPVDAETLVKLS